AAQDLHGRGRGTLARVRLATGAIDFQANIVLDHRSEGDAPGALALAPLRLDLLRGVNPAGNELQPGAGLGTGGLQRKRAVLPQTAPRRIARPRVAGNEDEALDAARHDAQPQAGYDGIKRIVRLGGRTHGLDGAVGKSGLHRGSYGNVVATELGVTPCSAMLRDVSMVSAVSSLHQGARRRDVPRRVRLVARLSQVEKYLDFPFDVRGQDIPAAV